MKNNTTKSRLTGSGLHLLCGLTIMLTTSLAFATSPEGRTIAIEQDADGFNLRWRDIAEAPYEVQTRTNLVRGTWGFLDIVMGTGGGAIYHVEPDASPSRFFRVLFPKPAITASEPALTDGAAGGSAIYVTGSFFYPGDLIRVGGMLASNSVYVTSSLLSADFPSGLQPGRYDIEIIDSRSGAVLATLPAALQVVDPVEDPHRMLLEPPTWPPAGPTPPLGKEFKGHVSLLKAFDDGAPPPPLGKEFKGHVSLLKAFDDGAYTPPAGKHVKTGHVSLLKAFDDEPPPPPAGKHVKTGHVSLLKAFDDDVPPPAAREHVKTGHVSLLKAFGDEDCDGAADLFLHSGEIQQQITDLQMPGRGLDFVWTRTYRSRTGEATSQGNRWTHSYDVRCVVKPGETDAWLYDGTGRKDLYLRQADNTFTCPGFFREGRLTNGIFRLTFADTGFWEFNPQGGAPAAGKLARIQDRNNNAITLSYDGAGRLLTITDTLDRVHTLAYTPDGRIASVTDSTGRIVTYAYYGSGGETGGSAGDLRSVTSPPVIGTPNGNDFPDGKTVTYTYTSGYRDDRANHLLLTITDALGQIPLHCDYDTDPLSSTFQRCLSAQRGSHQPTCVTYIPQPVSPVNRFAAMRCLVNDAVGNVSELSFDIRNRCVTERMFTGLALPGLPVTDSDNRPTGKLRESDPDLFETTYSWNRDNRLIGGMLPGGNVLSFVYEADLNPFTSARKRGDCRSVRERAVSPVDLDGDGAPDVTERVTTYEYDARFGSETYVQQGITHICPQCLHPGFTDRVSDDVYVRNYGFKVEMKGFVTSTTDPRGNVTEADFDAYGNRKNIRKNITVNLYKASFAHNTHGQLISVTNAPDATGFSRIDTFTYYGTGPQTGYLESIAIDEPGVHLTTTFEYDARGNVTRVVDPRGNDLLVTYNALNQPIIVPKQTQGATFGERVKKTLFYDANNNLVRIDRDNRGPDGAFAPLNPQWTTTFEYDPLKRLTQVAQEVAQTAAGQSVMTNQFVYNPNDLVTLHRLPEAVGGTEPNNVVAYSFDERGLLFSEARAPGTGLSATETFDYDSNGSLLRVSKSDAFTSTQTLFSYDGFDRCVTTLDPMGNIASRAFDATDNLVYERTTGETNDRPGEKGNRKLAETRYTYDGLDRCINRIDSFFDVFETAIGDGEATTTWTYAPNDQLVSMTDDNGASSTCTYDRAGRLAAVTDPKGNVSSYAYDPCGNVLVSTQSDLSDVSAGQHVFTKTYTYDALGRCLTATDNMGNSVSNAYDACNNLVSSTDPKGNETAYVYDGLGRVTGTANYSGSKERGITINTSHVEYRNNRLVSTTDANTNTTSYTYDACDRVTTITNADMTAESLVWSPRSNLERRIDANGTTITNSYDLCDRLIHRDIAVGAGVLDTTTFETFAYDGLGRLVTAQNNASTLLYSYDSLGNRVTSSQNDVVASATFDGLGNRRTCTCPSGYFIQSTYDALNRPVSITVHPDHNTPSDLLLMTFAYDGPGRLAKITRGNGINTRVFWDGVQGTPNAAGDYGWRQVSRINHSQAGGGLIVDQRVSLYDRNQNKSTRAMTAAWSSGGTLVTNSYTYDAVNRLTQSHKNGAIIPTDFQYVYDANGNRLQVTNNGVAEVYTMDPTMPDPADFQMNQYTDTPFGAEYHDAKGNRTGRHNTARSLSYKYDYADRLVQVEELDPIGSYVTLATYSYDPLGRRIGKTVFVGGGLPPVATTFVYDDGKDDDCDGTPDDDVMEVYKGVAVSSVSVLAGGAGGGAAAASYAATGRMLSPPVGFLNAAGEVFYTHCDERGNMLALTDAAGNVVEHYDYADFGAPLFFDRLGMPLLRSAVSNDVLFAAMRWDEETELYHREGTNPLYQENNNSGNNPLAEVSSCSGGGGTYFDPMTGQPLSRSKGTVKFFNETKGFGRIGGGSTTRAQDHNSVRSNKTASRISPDGGSNGSTTRAQDHNSVRSNKTASRISPNGGSGGSSTRAQDHNSSRSNKTASFAAPDGGSGGGSGYTPVNLINPIAMDKGLRF